MKCFIVTLLLHVLAILLVWLTGWLIVSPWYESEFGKDLVPIISYAVLPALISMFACAVIESILWRVSVTPVIIIMILFVLRVMLMLVLSAVVYIIKLKGEGVIKVEKITFFLAFFFYYGAILFAHIASNLLYNRIEK